MVNWEAIRKTGLSLPVAGALVFLAILVLASWFFALSPATGAENRGSATEKEIWNLEEAYFSNLYKADYAGVLSLVHSQFLGWPGNLPRPIGREESAQFMKKLISQPTQCTIRIERAGLQQSDDTVLTQYTLHVDCPQTAAAVKTQSSRITHTWTRQNGQWKLLGGMSIDNKSE